MMGLMCTIHWNHMHTTWESHAQHMSITCTPFGFEMALGGYDDHPVGHLPVKGVWG